MGADWLLGVSNDYAMLVVETWLVEDDWTVIFCSCAFRTQSNLVVARFSDDM